MEEAVLTRLTLTSVMLIVICVVQPVQVQQVAVASFQMDGRFSNVTYMRHRHKFTGELTNLTQCMHIRLARLRGVQTVFLNYATDEEADMLKSGKGPFTLRESTMRYQVRRMTI